MRLLLDENLPHQMRFELTGHETFTVAYMGWSGVENGELLRLAAAAGFQVLITNDRGLEHQQNLATLPLAVVVILAGANTQEAMRPILPELLLRLDAIQPCEFVKLVVS